VRHREDHQLAATQHLRGVEHGHIRQHTGDTVIVRAARDTGDGVPRARERSTDHRSDPSGPDDADAEPAVSVHAELSCSAPQR
jgi:hypothetical protein